MLNGTSRFLYIVASVLVIGGCSLQPTLSPSPYATSLNEEVLFVRGTFNWWGAQQSYRFVYTPDDTWAVDIPLLADGTVYDFKIADANWSQEQNCGSLDTRILITDNDAVPLFCDSTSLNFQYIASSDGVYRFSLFKPSKIYKLKVKKLDD